MKSDTKTILLVAPYFPPHSGGLERYVYEISKNLALLPNNRVVVLTSGEKEDGEVVEKVENFTVYRLPYAVKVSNTPFHPNWFFRVRQILKTEKPDVINVHTPVPGLGDIAAFFARCPLIVSYHASSMKKGIFVPDMVVWLYEHLALPFLLRKADKIICSSDYIRFGFLKGYQDKSVTSTPGVNYDLFTPNLFVKAKDPTVLFVAGIARSEQYKGLHILIDAVAKAKPSVPNIRLLVVGEGDMRDEYQTYAAERGLSENIEFAGKLMGEALAKRYQEAHVFALPSRNESFGMVILEAMATGLPVIAAKTGGIPTLVSDNENGFLIEATDVQTLSDKLVLLMTNSSVAARMGDAGRKKALANYSWHDRAEALNALCEALLRPLIVHAVGYYPPHLGGMERVAEEVATGLAKDGWKTLVLTSNGKFVGIKEKKNNLTVTRLMGFEFAHTPVAPTLPFHLLTLPKKSIIHLHLSQAFWPELVLFVSKVRGIPYVVHMHLDVAPSGPLGNLFLMYKKWAWPRVLRGAATVIVCSEDLAVLAETIYHISKEKIVYLPNGISESFFADREYQPSSGAIELLYVGRLVFQKKVERLIEMMAALTIPAHLTIVGDGEDRESLEKLTKEKKLTTITFVGLKNDAEIQAFHRSSDALVISSDREGMPLAVLEAMAGKLPVIGTDVPGLRELLSGVGVLVSEPFAENLAKAVTDLAAHPEMLKELSKKSETLAGAAHWQDRIRTVERAYNELI